LGKLILKGTGPLEMMITLSDVRKTSNDGLLTGHFAKVLAMVFTILTLKFKANRKRFRL
jgi:hypothetical protein